MCVSFKCDMYHKAWKVRRFTYLLAVLVVVVELVFVLVELSFVEYVVVLYVEVVLADQCMVLDLVLVDHDMVYDLVLVGHGMVLDLVLVDQCMELDLVLVDQCMGVGLVLVDRLGFGWVSYNIQVFGNMVFLDSWPVCRC